MGVCVDTVQVERGGQSGEGGGEIEEEREERRERREIIDYEHACTRTTERGREGRKDGGSGGREGWMEGGSCRERGRDGELIQQYEQICTRIAL